MIKSQEIVKRVTLMVMDRKLDFRQAAELLESSVRTIANYKRRIELAGPAGLQDRRHGTYCKITPEMQREIVHCKMQRPQRSANWIRKRLRLPVSAESVRRVLIKSGLNGRQQRLRDS